MWILLEPEYLAVSAVVAVPVFFGYFGAKSLLRLAAAASRGQGRDLLVRERSRLLLLAAVNALFASLYLYGWLIEADDVELVQRTIAVRATGTGLRGSVCSAGRR
jgi:hypothetical protein